MLIYKFVFQFFAYAGYSFIFLIFFTNESNFHVSAWDEEIYVIPFLLSKFLSISVVSNLLFFKSQISM